MRRSHVEIRSRRYAAVQSVSDTGMHKSARVTHTKVVTVFTAREVRQALFSGIIRKNSSTKRV
jgi:hypothetical protein